VSSAAGLLRWQFRFAHRMLEGAVDGLPGEAGRPVIRYAQVVLCEDLTISGGLAAGAPLALSVWAGHTGLSELPRLAVRTDWGAWEARVRVDLEQARRYAEAVYGVTDAFLAELPDEALDPAGGEAPACLLTGLLLTLARRRGELGCG
jgi:hypothetical protein